MNAQMQVRWPLHGHTLLKQDIVMLPCLPQKLTGKRGRTSGGRVLPQAVRQKEKAHLPAGPIIAAAHHRGDEQHTGPPAACQHGRLVKRRPFLEPKLTQLLNAATSPEMDCLASPNSMRVFSPKNRGLSTPEKPEPMERLSTNTVRA